jgi:thymidylate kinase
MPVVFVDGVDGAGKTTLIHHLARTQRTQPVHIADPLWHYLPAVTDAADFAPWVTSTPAEEVAAALIDACIHRLDHIRQHLGSAEPDNVVLVDRGPRTVAASARAHVATGHSANAAYDPQPAVKRLKAAVMQTAKATACMTAELRVTSYDAILYRLSHSERTDARYLHYLRAFLHHFETEPPWLDVQRIELDATANVTVNVETIRKALRLSAH